MQQNSTLVRGLTEPGEFRDNCGFGLIAHMEGNASHELLQTAIEALTCMTHRGGINADGKTGDGCGLLLKKPDSFFRKVAEAQSISLPELCRYPHHAMLPEIAIPSGLGSSFPYLCILAG